MPAARTARFATSGAGPAPRRVPLNARVLILGGTLFLGRALARVLVDRGHDVSIFTRGRTQPDPDLPLTRYHGDRDGGLASLPRDGWDAVIDTSAHWPSWVAASAAHLARAKRYVYVSSISVYDATGSECGDGISPYADAATDLVEGDMTGYGAFKRRSEDVVRAVFGDARSLVVRPGLIVGPHDPTDRFTYWVDRGAEGGAILAPGDPADIVQFIDVRDLAEFVVAAIEDRRSGTYDVTGARGATTIGDVIAACTARTSPPAAVTWIPGARLETLGLDGWEDVPLWIAPKHRMPGLMNVPIDRALRDGLRFRSLTETVDATRAWSSDHATRERRAGLSRTREAELLTAARASLR